MQQDQPARGPIDARRQLRPRDYFVDPYSFGQRRDSATHVPEDGDEISRTIADLVHSLVVTIRSSDEVPSGAAIARRFGFSRQTWSSVTRGERWPGHTVFTALVVAIRDLHGRPSSGPESTAK